MPDVDLVFREVTVVDGSGNNRYLADVAVSGEKIAAIDPPGEGPQGHRVIDGVDLVLAPGFIDMHSHSDLAAATDSVHMSKLAQGCTTEVVGQDGLSYVPANADTAKQLAERLSSWNGVSEATHSWRSISDYGEWVDRASPVNIAYLIPHGTVRMLVMGWKNRRATDNELDQMRRLIADGMAAGAYGLSAGLTYPPGMYADTDELVALCTVVASYGGYFSPHQRSYGAEALDAYQEMIEVARRSGCRLHLTHATMNFDINQGKAEELLALIDAANVPTTLDTYPYLAGATSLAALLPSWVMEDGQSAGMARLSNQDTRAAIKEGLDVTGTDGCHGIPVNWSNIEISGVKKPEHRHLVGRTIQEASDNQPPSDFFLDLLIADECGTSCLMHVGDEDNVRTIMSHRAHTVGSDGLLGPDRPHPRAWGTFPRYLGHYCRELGMFSLEQCVAKMTGKPADILGVTNRGLIALNYLADLVLFDPRSVIDTATFEDPRQPPVGIKYVIVNGHVVVDQGERTLDRPGKFLRHSFRSRVQFPETLPRR